MFFFKKAIEIKTDYVDAHHNLSLILKHNKNDDHLREITEFLHRGSLDQDQEVRLRYFVGKVFEDIRDFAGAFEQFRKANSLRKSICGYNARLAIALIANLKNHNCTYLTYRILK